MSMKVADLEIRSIIVNYVNFHCKDLDHFRSMPKVVQFRNNVYYKKSFHPGNFYACYVCEPDLIYVLEEDEVGPAPCEPEVLVSSGTEDQFSPNWVPLDALEKGLADGTYDRGPAGFFKSNRDLDPSLN